MHYAVLSLFDLKDFVNNRDWMASKLNITRENLDNVIKDLEKIGYLNSSHLASTVNMAKNFYISPSVSKESVQKMTVSQLEKLIETYKHLNLPYENNNEAAFTSYYVATSKDKIEDAHKMLEASFAQVGQFLEESEKKKKKLYTISYQIIPLTNK